MLARIAYTYLDHFVEKPGLGIKLGCIQGFMKLCLIQAELLLLEKKQVLKCYSFPGILWSGISKSNDQLQSQQYGEHELGNV